jgi:hypothetical protein
MSAGESTRQCSICGQAIVQAHGVPVPECCPTCGASLEAVASLADGILGGGAPERPPAATSAKSRLSWSEIAKAVIGPALLWGLGGAVCGAAALGGLSFLVLSAVIGNLDLDSFWGGADFGVLIGFLLCFMWGVVSRSDAGMLVSMLVGAAVGVVATVLHYWVESYLIAQSNLPVYVFALIGLTGGTVAGFVCVWIRESREE